MGKVLVVLIDDDGDEVEVIESEEIHNDSATFLYQDVACTLMRTELGMRNMSEMAS